ncbi:Uncharacterized protein dnm_047230 [Desulfonema magnum]|uniref:Uncharacterized protein n=1 Tax=Desulfonema magnum TaxID=45655 RepID=A0A975GP58_9BACT|nr:Uncharacterized protein dnm_047230 [Desulfonema magnum]
MQLRLKCFTGSPAMKRFGRGCKPRPANNYQLSIITLAKDHKSSSWHRSG